MTCQPVIQVGLNTLTCALPALNDSLAAALYGQYNSLQATFPSYGLSTNTLHAYVYSFPSSPVLSSVSGCTSSNDSLTLIGCRPGDVLTITGEQLNSTAPSTTYINWYDTDYGYFLYCTVLSATYSTLQCQLPFTTPDLSSIQGGQLLTWSLEASAPPSTGRIFGSQPFQMTFTWQSASAQGQTTTSSSSNTAAIIAGVMVPVFVIALLVVGWLWYRRAHKPPSPRNEEERGSGGFSPSGGGWSHSFGSIEMK